ncbi:MAG: glutamate--tRNA ligase, partial [Pseudomonadota bacterium]
PFAHAEERLAALGVDEALWLAVRGNLDRLEDAAMWRDVVQGELTPVIAEEDRDFTAAAAVKALDVSADAEGWAALTSALKSETGRKGKGLFMPLRLALTGQKHGPEMPSIFALIGKEKAAARLRGETA